MDHIELSIKAALEQIPAKAEAEKWKGETPWTTEVKSIIVSIGRENGYFTAANGCESDEGTEWLYDVSWHKLDKDGHITSIPLVAESEWGDERSIKQDFEKLLISRSKYRVMVFQGRSETHVRELIAKMRIWISKFNETNSSDRFFFAGFARNNWTFDFGTTPN